MKNEKSRNDKVNGLKTKVSWNEKGEKKTQIKFTGKYGQGYDGCGTHSHT